MVARMLGLIIIVAILVFNGLNRESLLMGLFVSLFMIGKPWYKK
ncbi:hypothetical protein [Siminovitchia fordii]|uniref:Uncharacterized protein n=1 Tax=Siminovitchia fordii TaxID=254759 RepID=A0ABQ4KAG4_9BACI|nr:hypothetical protein [Siminovitchia fordii]GIN22717.1 hypothetical protein J1TS3_38510 [Siminovitchia fordii]